jgi:hypothetical protein
LCAEYKTEWRKCGDDKEKLVKLVMRQQSLPYFITHCYQGKGLSKEYIIKNFPDSINGKRPILDADKVSGYTYSIFVAFDGVCKPDNDVSAFMWCNDTTLEINTAKCPVIYVGCGSELHLVCDGYNSPKIYLFDDSKLVIDDADDTSSIIVYKYSDNASVDVGKYCTTQNLKVFQKELKL